MLFNMVLIDSDHAFALSVGNAIVSGRVFSCQPRNMIVSAIAPSPASLRSEAVCGRLVGSSVPPCGRNWR